ncbi:MAG: hypothetical protein CL515_03895 [Actinobacteria bacterium]|nr:hypothetical protein [Actinomycetota bacterium]|tara:strand:- start:84502 stop:84786 length:285 start_codon:yes stop_codon:yes gene_type:complete
MPSIAVSPGTVVDTAGTGAITPAFAKYTAGGVPILAIGDVVAAHSSGGNTHPATAITTGSVKCTIGGKGIAFSGSVAGCAGPVTTTFVAKYQVS